MAWTDRFYDLILHQFKISCLAAKQSTRLVVEPERINEDVVDLAQFILRRMIVVPAADYGGLAGFDVMDQFCLIGNVFLQYRVTKTDTGGLMRIASADAR